ncbi:MAG: BON domain-containing protein [Pseudomonadota bacterium]|nr:BON domain-containing protein [Pseudomonadota bacterium]
MTGLTSRISGALALVALAGALAGCVPAALVGGAVGAGALLMTADRRSGETQHADRNIETEARERVTSALPGRGHVTVTSYYRKTLITGEVPNEQDRQQVHAIVAALPGVQGVINELAVMPESGAASRSNDAFISSKVRARLLNQNGVPSGSIKVLTERGTTYLMGRLTTMEANLATEVARQTDGVQRVVRIIDIMVDPEQAGGTSASPAPAPTAGTAVQITSGGEAAAAPGVETHPVTQPVIVNTPPPVQVQTLPPMK